MAYVKKEWVGSADPLEGDPGSTAITDDALNHLETQYDESVAFTTSAISGKLNTSDAPELIRDTMGSTLVAGANVTITVDDPGNTITIAASGGGGAVDSVNGQTGVVVLDAEDVGALPEDYVPPAQDWDDITGKPAFGSAALASTGDFATAAQGTTADTAVQPGDLANVATSGAYSDLSGLPTLGTAAAAAATDFATATQGAKADSAVQPAALADKENVLTAGANITINRADPDNPIISASGGGGGAGDWGTIGGTLSDQTDLQAALDAKADSEDLGTAAEADSTDFATAAQGAKADTAVQPGGLATVATSGDYADLTGAPTLGTAAAASATDFATAAQGATADSAVQPGDLATVATSGSYDDLTDKPTIPDASGFWPNGEAETDLSAMRGDSGISLSSTVATILATSSASLRSATLTMLGLDAGEDAWYAYKPGGTPTLAAVIDNVPVISIDDTGADFNTPTTFTDDVTVPDDSFTIAKTNGLQTALDSKVESGNSSITGVEYYASVEDLPATGETGVIYFVDAA